MSDTIEMTIAEFVTEHKITITAEYTPFNPNMDDKGADMDNWRCELHHARHKMTVYFSMGMAHGGKQPTAVDVLDCLARDSTVPDGFEEFCDEFGYDTDSRKAESTHKNCIRQRNRLQQFLGGDLFQYLVYRCERL